MKANHRLIASAITVILVGTSMAGQVKNSKKSNSFTIHGRIELSNSYNDNILDYSDRDIAKFDSVKYASSNLKKFSINRTSDNITTARLRLVTTFRIIDNAPTTINLRLNQSFNNANHIRNYTSAQLEVKQVLMKKNYLTLGFSSLPRYYLRNYWYHQKPERNPYHLFSRYVEAYLSKKSYSIDIGRNFNKRISGEIGYEYEYTSYNREFNERNNSTHNLKFDADIQVNKVIKFSGAYGYAISWASGRVNPDSTIADISYRSNKFSFGLNISMKPLIGIPLRWKNNLVYENQNYLSGKIPVDTIDANGAKISYGDKYHYGRKDNFYRINTELTFQFFTNFDIFLQYFWEQNKTNLAETSDAGSYQTHQVGVGARATF